MDIVLARLLPRADKLRGLGFSQKLSVLDAAWRGPADAGNKLCKALFLFNELRNSIAHGDEARIVNRHLARLAAAFAEIFPDHHGVKDIQLVAAGLVGFLADGPVNLDKLRIPEPKNGERRAVAACGESEKAARE
ncbi:hypothetical protein [Sphingomonas cavernae]|uniref:hypothetical protein n=1 Tax=Sphingomonas cavernae TaxID=2320861 RepID=UPI0011C3B437|nr:hypothetical protein [Sphingomonas cavernae]